MGELTLLWASLLILTSGAIVTALLSRYRLLVGYVAFLFVLAACAGTFLTALEVFGRGTLTGPMLLKVPGLVSHFRLKVDCLSAFFLLITSLIAVCATLYSVRYILIYKGHNLVKYYPLLLLFFASVISVVSVWDMLFFIVFWEVMTLTSYGLVVFEREKPEVMRAGLRYFITTHIATGCMILAAVVLYLQSGSFDFRSLREAFKALLAERPGIAHLVLFLFFVGFATKAGILPFGFWLPDAYPAAPTGASAAFAGTMTKLGVYGIVRVFAHILPISHHSYIWGEIIALFGVISIFVGTCTALVQSDSKRLLSFHIIGQVGYMLLGVGTGICFLPVNPAIAVAGLVAGLFHVINHAFYKSLLFLNAGAALYKTGTRDLNRVWGLINVMPLTAICAVIASLSIAGVPPFSGFSSKWLIFQSSITGGISVPLFLPFAIVAIFISTVTLASFLKFLGTLFLGKLYAEGREVEKGEVPLSMRVPQVVIAIFCVLFGIVPMLPIRLLGQAVGSILPVQYQPPTQWMFGISPIGVRLNLGEGISGIWDPSFVVVALIICTFIAWLIYKTSGAPVREVDVWACGEEHALNEIRYKAHGFYLPFQDFLSFRVGRYRVRTYFPTLPKPRAGKLANLRKAFDFDKFYYWMVGVGRRFCERFSAVHAGYPQLYVLWMILGLIIAIAVVFALT